MNKKNSSIPTTVRTLVPFEVSNVYSVYSGRPGCACGCRGKYSYSKQHQDFASKDRGYAVTDDEVSDKNVKRITEYFNQHLSEVETCGEDCFSLEVSDTRMYTLYTVQPHKLVVYK